MLDYIKSQVRARNAHAVQEQSTPENVPNDVITEYAHLFQEMELSEEGTDAGKVRKMAVDIPLEEDPEIESVEISMDGRVVDVPGDAAAPTEEITESYQTMKTYDNFYQEALAQVPRLMRESDDHYNARVTEVADVMYNEYCVDAEKIGDFGFTKINITDEKVPSKMLVDFGVIQEGATNTFMSKVNIFYATDEDHNIIKKQLDSVRLVKDGAFQNIGSSLKAYMESAYDISADTNVWDVCTPKSLIVPKGNGDSFCVVLEYANEVTGKNEYFGWTRPVTKTDDEKFSGMETVNMESFVNETHYENKDRVIQESLIEAEQLTRSTRKRPLSRFYQEAIDFGDGGGDGGSDLPPAQDGGDTAPAADTTTDAGTPDASGDANAAPAEGGDDNKKVAAVNDVSADIAKKVQEDTQNDANNATVTFPDENPPADDGTSDVAPSVDTGDTSADDAATTDTSSLDDIPGADDAGSGDDSIDGIDNTAVDDTSDDFATADDMDTTDEDLENGDMNVDMSNMTIDEIMDQANEKVKGMTLDEIKNFITNASPSEIQEAFILTKKNINKEVDIRLRETLGVLNDNKMNIDSLVKKFKHVGHRLNRVLSKATKMSGVYSSDEVGEIKKLNNILGQLIISLKKKDDSAAVPNIKRQITEFTNQSKIVGAFVEDKLNAKPVQEAFLLGNINDRITKALIPVKGQMETLKKANDTGNLTRGKLRRMYAVSGVAGTASDGSGGVGYGGTSTGTLAAKRGIFSGITEPAKELNTALKLCNKALRKKEVENTQEIMVLAEKLDLISDYIETILDSSNDNAEMLKRVGILANELIDLIDQFIGDNAPNVEPTEDAKTEEEEPTTPNDEPDFDVDDVTGEEPTEPSEDNDTENGEEDDV